MAEIEFYPEKDQHLLKDKFVLSKEVGEAMLSKADKVIEIGAGTGILTERLAQKAGEVCAFEVDERFSESLDKIKERHSNLKIVYGNALDYSWKGYNKIVSNIPYTLSEAIIQKAIREKIEALVLIVSNQFKDSMLSDTKFGIIANLFFEIELIMPVSRKAFFPSPKIESFMIKLKRKKPANKTEDILRGILLKEGKTKNALMYSLVKEGKTKNQAREIIEKMGIPENILGKSIKKASGKFILILKEDLNKIIFP